MKKTFKNIINNRVILEKSESTISNDRSIDGNRSKSLRIVLPILNSGEINSIKSSQALIKKLINTINSYY